MKAKRILGLSILSLAMISITAGCGGSASSDSQGNTIVKLSLMNSINENPGWLAMIDAANEVLEKNGDKVVIEPEIIKTDSWDEYYTKITSNILGKIGGTIGRIAESHVPMMIKNKQVAELSDVVKELKDTGEFTEGVFEGVAKDSEGKYYGIPTGTQHMVLYYNKNKFDEYNKGKPLAEQIPYPSGDWSNATTFAQIRDAAKKLTYSVSGYKHFGISVAPFLAYAGMYSKNSGGENIFNDKGECVIDSDPFHRVYKWFEDMLITDKSAPSTSDTATLDAMARFQGGTIAMIIDGVWQIHDICEYTEDFDCGIAAIPVETAGNKSYTTTFADRFWAARNSSHPEADKKALKALMSVEAVNALAAKGVGGMPVRTASIETYLNGLKTTELADYTDVIKNGVANKVNVPYSTYYNQVDQQINQKMSVWLNGNMSTTDFVKFMDKTMKDGMEGKL